MIELWHLPLLFLTGFVAESYGTVVGSGGVLIQFVLTTLGLPLNMVVANDIAGAIGSSVGVLAASKHKPLKNNTLVFLLAIPFFIGGIIGTLALINLPIVLLKSVLVIGMILLLLVMLKGDNGPSTSAHSLQIPARYYPGIILVMILLGAQSTASGVGSGTFQKIALLGILRLTFADSLLLNNLVSLPAGIFFLILTAYSGLLVWPYVVSLWLGTFIAGVYATRFVHRVPDRYLRWLLIAVTVLYLVALLI